MNDLIDLFVIGGGINGTAIAADASGRGLSVVLCEKNDLASGTSSASTKLIHGGLRYLEFYEFNLVRKALQEREILMSRAPNLIQPLEFILPYESHLRPKWMIRCGLFLYDYLSKRNILPKSKRINLANNLHGIALQDRFRTGFSYYDCFTNDARLVILNALAAKNHGAKILPRMEFVSAYKEKNDWKIVLKNQITGENCFYRAKGIINVAGPWVNQVQTCIEDAPNSLNIKLDKGSHIIVPKLYEGNFAYILQNNDQRIVFTIPYCEKFTLIGTTDIPFKNELSHIKITDDEIVYLCDVIKRYFKIKLQPKDVVSSYAGVRCLQNEPRTRVAKISREYKLNLDDSSTPFLLTVVGGKLTTHRRLAEEALSILKPFFPQMNAAWTARTPLPGCQFNVSFDSFLQQLYLDYPKLPDKLLNRFATLYGTSTYTILGQAMTTNDLGEQFSDQLYENEVQYLIQNEWAYTAEDILFRRTQLHLLTSPSEQNKLSIWLKNYFLSRSSI